jgi:succinate dehydrogenase assembly factor 2
MLENDLLLGTFAAKYLNKFNEKQLEMYDFIINMPSNDWDLYYWSVGRKEVPNDFKNEVMDLLIEHARNKDRESRIRQPDL